MATLLLMIDLATAFSVFCVSVVHGMTSSVETCSAAGDDMCCRICRRDGSCQVTPCNKQSLVRDVTDSKNSYEKSSKDCCSHSKAIYRSCLKHQCRKDGHCLTSIKQLQCLPVKPEQSSLSSEMHDEGPNYNELLNSLLKKFDKS